MLTLSSVSNYYEKPAGSTYRIIALLVNTQRLSVRMPSTEARCLKCGRLFQRLDTHLRVSATCRDVRQPPECLADTPTLEMNVISGVDSISAVASISNFCATLPGNLNSSLETTTTNQTATLGNHLNNNTPSPRNSYTSPVHQRESKRITSDLPTSLLSPPIKDSLRLPSKFEDWEQADSYFRSALVPSADEFCPV